MRVKEIDIARGLTVFIMPAVHVLMINANPATQASLLGKFFGFLAEGPGAQLFMLLMGLSLTLSQNKKPGHQLKKIILLFVAGYLLNFLKFDLPLLAGTMPGAFLKDLKLPSGTRGLIQLFLLGDILQFAAIGLLLSWLIYQLPRYPLWALAAAATVIAVSPVTPRHISSCVLLAHLTNLLFGYNRFVYFPVFPWLCYPMTGLFLGHYLQKTPHFYSWCLTAGTLLIITGKLICLFFPGPDCENFYRTGIGGSLYHIGFVLVWLFLIHLVVRYLPANHFCKLLEWLSRQITVVYFIQWILIFWLTGIWGYHSLGLVASLVYLILLSAFVFFLTKLLTQNPRTNHIRKPSL